MLFVTHTDDRLDGYCAAAAGMAWCVQRNLPTDVLITSAEKISRDLGLLLAALGRPQGAPAPGPSLEAYRRLLPTFAPADPEKGRRLPVPDIVVCGLDPRAGAATIPGLVSALEKAGCRIRWLLPYNATSDGRYPKDVDEQLALLEEHCDCQPVAVPKKSGRRVFLGAVLALELGGLERVKLLQAVLDVAPRFADLVSAGDAAAGQAGRARELSEPERYFLLARMSQQRYYLYADREASPAIVRKLAGVEGLTQQDKACDPGRFGRFHRALSGNSDRIKEVRAMLGKLAPTEARVMILGESGCGKDIVAEALHYGSKRAAKPFIAVNCAGLNNEGMLTAQLFGHKKGAFTGANEDRDGLVASANGGTLFLDEVGEMPAPCQAMLLRFLQNGSYHRVGDPKQECKADVRVLCATNRDLAKEIAQGNFREDLYYRLRENIVRVPPLRERPSDIHGLANQGLKEIWRKNGFPGEAPLLTKEQTAMLATYDWPGNVRQLHGVVANAFYLSLPHGGVPDAGPDEGWLGQFLPAMTQNLKKAIDDERQLGIAPSRGGEAAPMAAV
ncbi:MAG: sigma-54-dependent Fis family transcriptional regulator, partial [Planctomycetes bacterium]|nr:sigma-54-dependent Fis family transcriptional regulator [Planctomycetota bacterium]